MILTKIIAFTLLSALILWGLSNIIGFLIYGAYGILILGGLAVLVIVFIRMFINSDFLKC